MHTARHVFYSSLHLPNSPQCDVLTDLWVWVETHILSAGCNFTVTDGMMSIKQQGDVYKPQKKKVAAVLSLKCCLTSMLVYGYGMVYGMDVHYYVCVCM